MKAKFERPFNEIETKFLGRKEKAKKVEAKIIRKIIKPKKKTTKRGRRSKIAGIEKNLLRKTEGKTTNRSCIF